MENIVIIGAGVMGSALAIHLGNIGHKVNLWGTQWDDDFINKMKETRRSHDFNVDMPQSVSYFYHDQLEEAFKDTKLVVIAVISKGMESISKTISSYLNKDHYILSVTKGIDEKNLYTMSTVIKNSIPETLKDKVSVIKLGGPIIATELAEGRFTEGIFASSDLQAAEYASEVFRTPRFKADVSKDIEGVDLCAAFKNSYAIGMGIIEGLEGDMNNPKAALMARGAIEMTNIVVAYGGRPETALGIAGIGDYYVTAQGGRNGKYGKLLGQGNTVEKASDLMKAITVEGLAVTLNGYKLLEQLEEEGKLNMEKDTPLFLEIYNVLYNDKPAMAAIESYWLS